MVSDKSPIVLFGSKHKKTFYQISTAAYDWSKTKTEECEESVKSKSKKMSFKPSKNHNKKRLRTDPPETVTKKQKVTKTKSVINTDYNRWMLGVDKSNQLCQTYSCGRKVGKWTTHIVQLTLSFQKLVENALNSKWRSVVF